MGAGNPKLKSFDNDRYEPTTYFADFTFGGDDEFEMQMNLDDFITNVAADLKLKEIPLRQKGNYYPELSCAFREGGIVIAEGDRALLITESGAEYHHFPMAIVPNFKFEDFEDEDAETTEHRWQAELSKFEQEKQTIFKSMMEYYPEMSQRAGAWCSTPVAEIVSTP